MNGCCMNRYNLLRKVLAALLTCHHIVIPLWVIVLAFASTLSLIPHPHPQLTASLSSPLHRSPILCFQVEQADKVPEPEPEPSSEVLQNPARVLPAQEKYIRFSDDSRYTPICKAAAGFVLLKDRTPELPEELALTEAPATAGTAARTGGAQRTTGRSTAAAEATGGGAGVHAAARAAVRATGGTGAAGAGGAAAGGGAGGSGARAAPPRSTEEEDEDEPTPPESFDYK